ncbi:transglycosylase domain-containing protein [Salinisphaera hydrothermalis]|uniref:transglycosylase domain-containing protein n=1 Tax=Salinisphaera hydrothermalis TaxID=563188 RepID=UPI00333FEEEB
MSADRVIKKIDDARFEFGKNRLSLFDEKKITEIEWSVLLLEDRRFFIHSGVDAFRASLRILRQLSKLRRIGGISTIEQQLVRTLLDDRRRNAARKLRESVVANAISYRKRKIDILRAYLKYAYLGYKVTGIDSAANLLFNCEGKDTTPTQSDFIACLLVYPLPKAVIAQILSEDTDETCAEILSSAYTVAPHWSQRMARRMSYAAHLRRYSVKPFYEVH